MSWLAEEVLVVKDCAPWSCHHHHHYPAFPADTAITSTLPNLCQPLPLFHFHAVPASNNITRFTPSFTPFHECHSHRTIRSLPFARFQNKSRAIRQVTWRRGRRRKKLVDDLKDRRGYCQLNEEAVDRTMWRNRFGRGFGPVVWQITDDDDDIS